MKMKEENEQKFSVIIKKTLEILSNGGICYYAPLSERLTLLDFQNNIPSEGLNIDSLIYLRREGLIDLTDFMRQRHTIFHGRVDFYNITDKGRKYLKNEQSRHCKS